MLILLLASMFIFVGLNFVRRVHAQSGITRVQGIARGTGSGIYEGEYPIYGTLQVTLSQTPQIGDVLVAVIGLFWGSTPGIMGVTQSGVTWSRPIFPTYFDGYATSGIACIWIGVVNSATASVNVSVSFMDQGSGSPFCIADICEYSGVETVNYIDQTARGAFGNETSTSAVTGTTDQTTQANELWIGAISVMHSGWNPASQSNPTNGFTLLDGSGGDGGGSLSFLEKIVNSTGTASSGTTLSTSAPYGGIIVTLFGEQGPPSVALSSPSNVAYTGTSIPLVFAVNETTSWMGYSLDNQANVTVSGNTTLAGLSYGQHSILVYANDTWGAMDASDEVFFRQAIIVPDDFSTIQGAINAASDGDTIFVRNGTYSGVVIDKSVTLQGECAQATIVNGGTEFQNTGSGIAIVSDNVRISGFTIQNARGPPIRICGDFGVSYANITISNNFMMGNGEGIRLINTTGDVVSDNFISNNYGGIGLDWANDNIIQNNTLYNVTGGIQGGYPSYDNTFSENNIIGNNYGIEMSNVFNGNEFFNNNFINNTIQTSLTAGNNTWDNGYPSGGNYWSDYNGTDLYNGPGQNLTGSDGIGDIPYVIYANNTDNYPLMNPWTSPDIAVTTLTSSKTVIGQGYTASLNVSFENLGSKIEAFNATVYANSNCTYLSEQTLLAMANCTLSFTWNTTGFAYGNYTISAYAVPVSGETNTANNNSTESWVIVSLIGDITGPKGWPDGKVDMRDIAVIARCFGSKPGDSNWNPNADINGDGRVDMRDIALVARNFGSHT